MIREFLSTQIKENIWRVVLEYKEKREKTASDLERILLREELYKIKKATIDNLEEVKKQTIANLEKNKIKVFEARDAADARMIIQKLIQDDRVILKSKSNIADEIDLKSVFLGKELIETDLGDMINQWMTEEDLHPVFPAFHLTPEKIVEKIYQKFGQKIEPKAEVIANFARQYLRKKIPETTVGITGANVITADGRIILLENEGNISLVSRWPDRHIIISGVEKLAPDIESAMKIVKASAIWGAGQDWPVYVSIISGPSKTADIQNRLVIGAQGAKEVYLILVDNGRSRLLKEGFEELLYCLNCGACLNFCPAFHQLGRNYGDKYLGSKGIIFTALSDSLLQAKKSNAYACTLCSTCFENCPVKINLPELMKKIRNKLNGAVLSTEENKKMIANIQKFGNPFGEISENKPPENLYCC
ncbi:MAG: LUD domain-containing protein [Patescibacteria group bacterium]